jgi:GNAT superfamily N-acetyltransferase
LALVAKLRPRRVWHWVAWSEGKPVGLTTLCKGAGTAGLYGVEVLEQFRRKGIGSALVRAALQQAKDLGFNSAVLSASSLGKGVYEGQGFREVGKLSFWKYGKMRQRFDH